MKNLYTLLPFVALALASPLFEQMPIEVQRQYPGFNIDLNAQRLIQMEGQEPVWMSERDKIVAKARGVKFFDITDTPWLDAFGSLRTESFSYPTEPNATEKVDPILKTLRTDTMRKNLERFTSFRTRYYRSETGRQSQQWLVSRIAEITATHGSDMMQDLVTFEEFMHPWGQNSIILKIQGSTYPDEVVIIGAHQDSTNLFPFLPAPGADDDGSGSVTILEAYRALLAADFRPERTVEFHWYSAEEGGLLGSQAVAQEYAKAGVDVVSMNQFDMTAWVKTGTKEVVGVITDYVDPGLTEFTKLIIDTYLDIPYADTVCGYACSDHASWSKAGYQSAFAIESKFEDSNKNIHSTNDRIDISPEFSFDHMLEFAKLIVGLAVELGGWSDN